MPDDVLPTSVKFFLGPKNHQEKGMVIGSDSGTCLTLPSVYEAFRKTARLDEVPLDKLVLRPATVLRITKAEEEEISQTDVEKAFDAAQPARKVTRSWSRRVGATGRIASLMFSAARIFLWNPRDPWRKE